ncbi:MAG: redoxin domain-containing protein [Cytophagaceae bacterium]|jgi:hypothetical protein|nr:redoxin domain-containing protein [Cytophagaceae bacterium]
MQLYPKQFLKYSTVTFIFLCLSANVFSITGNSIRFTGAAPEYRGLYIEFNCYRNFIIPETERVAVMLIDNNGDFDFTFAMDETGYVFADLGRFRVYIYAEPGMSYTLVFPPFEPITDEQKLNPLFQPEEIPFGIKNTETQALNRNIIEFNDAFEYIYNTNAVSLFTSPSGNRAEELIKQMDERFTCTHPYFVLHKKYSYLKLRHLSHRTQKKALMAHLTECAPIYNLPVYWEIFRTLMSGYQPVNYLASSKTSLSAAINLGMPFDSIITTLLSDTLFRNREFAETWMLFKLFESFYGKSISEKRCMEITQSAVEYASTEQIRLMASLFFKKMSALRAGTAAPVFSLFNRRERTVELSDYKGKFLYLGFVHTKNYACLLDMSVIEQFEKTMKNELRIVTVVIDDDFDAMVEFMKKNSQYKWDFLHFGKQPTLLNSYAVKGAPLYYLIDPEGNLSLSPAPSPQENFRQLFAEKYLEYQRVQLRKNPPEEKSIFDW